MQPNPIRSPWNCDFSSHQKLRSFIYVEIIKAKNSKHHFSFAKITDTHCFVYSLISNKHSLDILKLLAATILSCWLIHDHFYKTTKKYKET